MCSQDVIHRWSYPLVPSIFSTQGRYAKYKRNNVYISPDVILARSKPLCCARGNMKGSCDTFDKLTLDADCMLAAAGRA